MIKKKKKAPSILCLICNSIKKESLWTYCHGSSKQKALNAFGPPDNPVNILSKLTMFQKAASSPVCIIKSNGESKSSSANFRDTALTSNWVSSVRTRLEWRRRTGNTCPTLKNSCSGRSGLSTTVAVPMAPTPLAWVPRWRVIRVFKAKRVLYFFTYRAICDALRGPGSGGG